MSERENVIETATGVYWTLSSKWRGRLDAGDMTFGDMIDNVDSLRVIQRGRLQLSVAQLMDDVVEDRRPKNTVRIANEG